MDQFTWQIIAGVISGQNLINRQIIRALDNADLVSKDDLAGEFRRAADEAETQPDAPDAPRADLLMLRHLASLLEGRKPPDLRVIPGGKSDN